MILIAQDFNDPFWQVLKNNDFPNYLQFLRISQVFNEGK